ncbi:MAG: uroporphyrinogen-III C-methyltransferase [Myxococcales bacterium]|nr:uroporphyrinogen-III C-methyltransferase [Myxococcales bacterium]
MSGFVSIVGAGPWDPELLTLAGRERLRRADVVIADYLVNPAHLMHCRADATIHQRVAGPHDGRLDQARVNALMVEEANAGRRVVRLKGGDPMIFGRGSEEADHLRAHGVAYELVPGVSAAIAAPEAAGIPLTHRDHTPAVSIVSGFEAFEKGGLHVAWDHLAKSAGTIVLMMSVKNCRQNAERLIAGGRDPETPAALIRWGTRGIMRTLVATLSTIADRADEVGLRAPAVLVVGTVVELRERIEWFERRPLFGRRIVVTRASHQAGELIQRLAAEGADAVAFPCLAIAPPEDPEALRSTVAAIADFNGVILSSPNGVNAFFDALAAAGLDARALADRKVAVIGTGTAGACEARGIRPDIIPAQPRAEGLIAELAARELLCDRWLHVRADEGRDLLGPAIAEAGGSYQLVIGYRTIRPAVPELLVRSLRAPADGGEGIDAITFASGKSARHLLETLREHLGDDEARAIIDRAKVIALGPVTAAAARALDLRVDAIADATTDEAMVAAILGVFGAAAS